MANNGRALTTNRLCGDFLMHGERYIWVKCRGERGQRARLDACDGLLRELCIMHGSSIVCRFVIVFILSEYVLHTNLYKQNVNGMGKYYFFSRIIVMNLIH